jgi:hypothetical protein
MGSVTPTLALTLSSNANLGTFVPGLARDYETSVGATVNSYAGDATLSVADPAANAGRLVNGAFVLASPLQAKATNTANPTRAFAPVTSAANPLVLLTYAAPVSSDQVTITLRQSIASDESLRTGTYSKTLTFTLSTTTP